MITIELTNEQALYLLTVTTTETIGAKLRAAIVRKLDEGERSTQAVEQTAQRRDVPYNLLPDLDIDERRVVERYVDAGKPFSTPENICGKIQAIKMYKARVGTGLRNAKDKVEEYIDYLEGLD